MFAEFYRFVTYNPENIPVREIVVPLLVMWAIITAILIVAMWACGVLTRRTVVLAFPGAAYCCFAFFWAICFSGDSFVVEMLPVFPLIGCYVLLLLKKKIRKKSANS